MKKPRRYFAYRSFWPELETVRRFGEAGINTIAVFPANTCNSLGEPYSKYPANRLWFNTWDFTPVAQQFDDLIAVNPKAEFIALIDLNSPLWLSRQLPGKNGDSLTNLSEAISLPRWRESTEAYCDAIVDYLESHYGERIRAYVPMCGATDEWMDNSSGGAGPEKQAAYLAWCKEKGYPVPDDVPGISKRSHFGFEETLRDPDGDAEALRYWRFTSQYVCRTLQAFANRIRNRCRREVEIGAFYGYLLELGGDWVKKGHLALEELLSSGSVDFVITPGTYEHREMGGGGGFMLPIGTIHRFHRNYMHEVDHRTHCYNRHLAPGVNYETSYWADETEDIAGMRREMCLSLIHQTSLWWFDMWGGFYQSDAVFAELARMKKLWDRFPRADYASRAEIALVVDADGASLVNDTPGANANRFHRDVHRKLTQMGTPFEPVGFNDLMEPGVAERYKLLIFASVFELDEKRLAQFRQRFAAFNGTILWLYAAGISDGTRIVLDRNKELTGVAYGTPGLCRTEQGSSRTYYLHHPEELTVPVLRGLAREAEVFFWTEDDLPVFANTALAAFHTAKEGVRTLSFPEDVVSVTELFSGRRYPLKDHRLDYPFKGPDTVLFELHPLETP